MTDIRPHILWFRQDLRLSDNPALNAAAASGTPVLPVYVLDDINAADWAIGAAARWWLHRSLAALNAELGGSLRFFKGDAKSIILRLANETDASVIFWNRCYEPWRRTRDEVLRTALMQSGREVRSFNASLLFEPMSITKVDRSPYKVFTPFWNKGCLEKAPSPRAVIAAPAGTC